MSTTKIGITGAKGFIGSHLMYLLQKKNIKFISFNGNLLNDTEIKLFIEKNFITQIIHLAGTFNPPFENLINKNLLITEKLLRIGIQYGLKKIVYASSGAVYGEPLSKESFEKDATFPNTLYGFTKKCAEDCIKYYSNCYKLSFVILRFSNVYGPENKKGVIYNLLNDIKIKKSVTIYGDGKQKRDFLYIDDASNALLLALKYNKNNIFNISSNLCLSIEEVIQILKKKYIFDINYEDADNNLTNLVLNIDKAKKELHFVPQTNELRF